MSEEYFYKKYGGEKHSDEYCIYSKHYICSVTSGEESASDLVGILNQKVKKIDYLEEYIKAKGQQISDLKKIINDIYNYADHNDSEGYVFNYISNKKKKMENEDYE
jgi:hypothetical protein